MKKQIIILTFIAFAVLFCVSCKNKQKIVATIETANITIANDTTSGNVGKEIALQENLGYFDIPENSMFKEVIANFYKFRDESRLFEGFEKYWNDPENIPDDIKICQFIDMEFTDTLLIFNFEKGTVKGIKRGKGIYRDYIKGFPTDRTITGDFNGDGKKDSLMVENFESLFQKYGDYPEIEDDFNFVFSDKTIPKLNVWGGLGYTIKNEGDLNGDGGDEIGFLPCAGASSKKLYYVFTLKNNKWYYLVEYVDLTRDMRATGIVPVEKDLDQDSVILIRSSAEESADCCAAYVVEKSVIIKDLKIRRIY